VWERLQTMHPRREIAGRDVRVAVAIIQTRRRKTITTATMIRMSTTVPSPIYMDKAFPKSRSRYLASVGRLRIASPISQRRSAHRPSTIYVVYRRKRAPSLGPPDPA
jgi:hypothetical protein